jgi:hypothetical protein
VLADSGRFGDLVKIPGGLTTPPGAPPTVTKVTFGDRAGNDGFVADRVNTVTVEYDAGQVQAQAADLVVSLLVASSGDASQIRDEAFDVPLAAPKAR